DPRLFRRWLLEVSLETVEDAGPAFQMTIAAFDAGEFLVGGNAQRVIASRLKLDGDKGFVGFQFAEIRSAAVFFPCPGEDEALGRFDVTIGANRSEIFTVGLPGLDAISA